jgi:hypothetical protein
MIVQGELLLNRVTDKLINPSTYQLSFLQLTPVPLSLD